jgi:hypothetical protein
MIIPAQTLVVAPPSSTPAYIRAGWVNPYAYSEAEREETLTLFEQAQLNTAFVLSPNADQIGNFVALIDALRARNIRPHLWVWCMSFVRASSANADQRKAYAQQLAELLAGCGLDALHLDGIRFDKYDTSTKTGPYAHMPKIDAAKTAAVTATVAAIRAAVPQATLSAAVQLISNNSHRSYGPFPDWPEDAPYHHEVQQNPLDWLNKNLIDFVVPMNYQPSPHWDYESEQWPDPSRVVMGLAWRTGETYTPTPAQAAAHAHAATKFAGFSVFEINRYAATASEETALARALGAIP